MPSSYLCVDTNFKLSLYDPRTVFSDERLEKQRRERLIDFLHVRPAPLGLDSEPRSKKLE